MISERDLLDIYHSTLARCEPSTLVRERLSDPDLEAVRERELNIVALGKCAPALIDGATAELNVQRVFAGVPQAYVSSDWIARSGAIEVAVGAHPEISDASFRAGERLMAFVGSSQLPILFLVSGGSSACVEVPLRPLFNEDDLITANRALVRSGLPIASINRVRKRLSAIKGGKLGAMAPKGSATMILSDVSKGRMFDVGSGPTMFDGGTNEEAAKILGSLNDSRCAEIAVRLNAVPDSQPHSNASETYLIADNDTLRAAAAAEAMSRGAIAVLPDLDLEGDVSEAVHRLIEEAKHIGMGELLIAGGEPTVAVRGDGRGGRCSELAIRFAVAWDVAGFECVALFGSSDGADGNTGSGGVVLSSGKSLRREDVADAIARSDSFSLASRVGSPIVTGPTGNNLRDLYLLARK